MKCGLISSLLGELGGGWVERWHLWAMVSHITVTLGCVWGTAAVNDESHPAILLGSAYYPHWLAIVLEEKICLLRMMCMTSLALALPPWSAAPPSISAVPGHPSRYLCMPHELLGVGLSFPLASSVSLHTTGSQLSVLMSGEMHGACRLAQEDERYHLPPPPKGGRGLYMLHLLCSGEHKTKPNSQPIKQTNPSSGEAAQIPEPPGS